MRGTIARAEIRRVLAATYHQVWWPDTSAVKYDGDQLPVWDEHTGKYLDPATGEVLPTWDQALDELGDQPHHVARFGTRFDAQGVLAGSKDAARCIGYLTKYLIKQGFLTGTIDATTTFEAGDFRNGIPRFAADARAANQAMVDLLARIAKRLDATPAQVALAWLLAQKPWVVPIPGTRKLARLDENIAAADLELTATDLNEIETASAAITVQGARYPEAMERLIDRGGENDLPNCSQYGYSSYPQRRMRAACGASDLA